MINDNHTLLANQIRLWGKELGFAEVRFTDVDLASQEAGLTAWLAAGHHGEMSYMAEHGMKRARPAELVPGARTAIMVRMDYLPTSTAPAWREEALQATEHAQRAVISVYARGRDYHKVLKSRLQQLAERIDGAIESFGYRVFTDSAPVMEVALAEKAGLGWRGKHTLLLSRDAGSMFFLGEIITDLVLPADPPTGQHCGSCSACITCCPTQAILGPYELDARRCISYLTIELKGSIPTALRTLIGNRVYGCDDCQLVCPWNKFAQAGTLDDFNVRNGLDHANLTELFGWQEADFLKNLEGSPIRRIGYIRWLRNLAVGLGNARRSLAQSGQCTADIDKALLARLDHSSDIIREHVQWALTQ